METRNMFVVLLLVSLTGGVASDVAHPGAADGDEAKDKFTPTVYRCCPKGEAMTAEGCVNTGEDLPFLPQVSKTFVSEPEPVDGVVEVVRPVFCDSIPVYSLALSQDRAQIKQALNKTFLRWKNEEERWEIKINNFCIDVSRNPFPSAPPASDIEYSAFFCQLTKQYIEEECSDTPCLRKCCPRGYMYNLTNLDCVQADMEFQPIVAEGKTLQDYKMIVGDPVCNFFMANYSMVTEEGYIISEGVEREDYCVDSMIERNSVDGKPVNRAFICFTVLSTWDLIKYKVFGSLLVVSIIFLVATVAAHIITPELRVGSHRYFISFAFAFLMGNIFLATLQLPTFIQPHTCGYIGFLVLFSYLAIFFWFCVLCFDMWSVTRGKSSWSDNVRFCVYSAYGWGGPLFITLVALVLALGPFDGYIRPDFGHHNCFLTDTMAVLLYFHGPMALQLIACLVFLILAFPKLKKLSKAGATTGAHCRVFDQEVTITTDTSALFDEEEVKNMDVMLRHRIILFTVMVICWIFEIVSERVGPRNIWIVTDILNSLQGFFVFIIFILNQRKRELVVAHVKRLLNRS
ncbi:putative G-protein coupled receptor Mth-like 1 [Oratosquilla oratoria]|uniref:putative G-protein coupled receptor Mth-like 1 n=1 Tax=Oratosquilla oratoria TaxID=337810 RepID=UPI003F75A412